jgi:hypothetical protein
MKGLALQLWELTRVRVPAAHAYELKQEKPR